MNRIIATLAICLAAAPALAKPQGVAEACRSVKASNDLAGGGRCREKICLR